MIVWNDFSYNGKVYNLDHLRPFEYQYLQEAQGDKPEKNFRVQICFSSHCFTKSGVASSASLLNYSDAKSVRTFDFNRYELSKKLPEIIMSLNKRKCLHTKKGNFFTIDVDLPNGIKQEYEVYFNVSKVEPGLASIFVESAYVRDEEHMDGRPSTKHKVSLYVLLHNKLNNLPIKIPK